MAMSIAMPSAVVRVTRDVLSLFPCMLFSFTHGINQVMCRTTILEVGHS